MLFIYAHYDLTVFPPFFHWHRTIILATAVLPILMADTNVRISRYRRALYVSYQYEIIVLDKVVFTACRRWTMDSKQQRREFQAIKNHDSFRQMHPSAVPQL